MSITIFFRLTRPSDPHADLNDPSYFDIEVRSTSDASVLPIGFYDGYCLNPYLAINGGSAGATEGDVEANFDAIPELTNLSQMQVDQINWILAQRFTADPVFGGQYSFGEVQKAIWYVCGYTNADISPLAQSHINYPTPTDEADVVFLATQSALAVADGNSSLPDNTFFTMLIDRVGQLQPIIIQLDKAKLGDYVWFDADSDGIQDANEVGVDGVTVELYKDNVLISTTTTGDNFATAVVEQGFYQFAGLKAGDYQVKFITPANMVLTVQDANANGQDAEDSDADTNTGFSQVVTLAVGESNQTIDAGLVPTYQPASLSGYVYEDDDNDGIFDGGEAPIANVMVTLTGIDINGDPVLLMTTTDANGYYEFTNLVPGTYQVNETQPANYLDGKDTAGSTGGTVTNDQLASIPLASGDNSVNNNFGELKPAMLSGYVYEDDDNDGNFDGGEAPIAGVTVNLTGTDDLGNPVVASTVTDANGFYKFDNLRPGSYQVNELQPANYLDGKDTAGSTGGSVTNDQIATIPLVAGDNSVNNNFGELKPAMLSGYVYEDDDNDGNFDGGEAPIAGVTVNLTGTDDLGNPVVASTVTDANGFYKFDNLRPGSYQVNELQPANYLDGKDTAGSTGGSVTNDQIATIPLVAGDNSINNNFGELKPAMLSGYVYEDDDNDGNFDGGEAPIAGVTVNLTGTDDLGNPVVASTVTDANGFYKFDNLRPGSYQVNELQPANYLDGKDTAGSTGGSVTNDQIATIPLVAGDNSVNNNFGELKPAMLSGYVYEDNDNDGVKDGGEAGIPGTTVTLMGTDDLGNAVLAMTVTDANGFYKFDNLRPGSYKVNETQPPAYLDGKDTAGSTGGTVTNDQIATIPLVAGDNSIDNNFGELKPAMLSGYVYEDNDNDGVKDGGEAGIPGTTVTLMGTDDLGNAVLAMTVTDANGFYKFDNLRPGSYKVNETQPPAYLDGKDTAGSTGGTVTNDQIATIPLVAGDNSIDNNFGELKPARVGDYIWEDKNANGIQEAGENGIVGVTVNLKDAGGVVIATTVTGAGGIYGFDVTPGTYSVQVEPPAGYFVTLANQGADDAEDSDITGPNNMTQNVTVGSGESNLTLDGGLFKKASIGDRVWLDCNENGKQDAGEAGVSNVTVNLKNAAGTVIATTTTDAMGNYAFSGLVPAVYSVQFVKPAGFSFTLKDAAGSTDANDSDADTTTGMTIQTTLESGENDTSWDAGLTAPSVCTTIDFSGNTGTDGADGNIRSYTQDGISVNVSAFARDRGNGAWSNAFLGAYGGGLGVTDNSEGSGGSNTHTIDNTGGKDNYVLFEFNQLVTLDAAYLGFVVGDSDLKVWIGTVDGAFNSHQTLSDAFLTSMGFTEVNTTTSSSARWADLNAGEVQGNVIIIAADTTDMSPEDFFKLQKLDICTAVCSCDPPATASLGDRVFLDCNENGKQDAGEAGVSNVTVNLKNAVGTVIATTTTDAMGNYAFTGLASGVYSAQFVKPAGYAFTTKDAAGSTDANDSDADTTTGMTIQTTLESGENDTSWDAGLTAPSVCTTIDFSGNTGTDGADGNIRSYTQDGISVNVSAFARDRGNGAWSNAFLGAYGGGLGVTDNSEGSGGSNTHTIDNTGGKDNYVLFEFNQLVTLDAAYLGFVVGDSDLKVWIGTVDGAFNSHQTLSDAFLTSMGFTEVNTTTSSSARWADLNGGEVQGNVIIIAADTTDMTPEDFFKLQKLDICTAVCSCDPPATASLGDRVFLDTNANGIQDSGETGVANVTVKLLSAAGVVLATTTTNSSGNYLFNNLAAGDYKVQVVKPSDYYFSKADQGSNNAVDSDVNQSSGITGLINLSNGENDLTWDAGIYKKACIGDRVWEDKNHNGIQDSGEPGIGNVKVYLQTKDASGNTITVASTTTDSNGNYSFSVDPGQYRLKFDKANVQHYSYGNWYNMSNWYWGQKDIGSDDSKDSDVTQTTTTSVQVTYTDWTTLTSGENDKTWDAAITPIVIDLNGDGVHTVSRADSAGTFDLFGNGKAIASGWVSSADGMLAVDKNGNGTIDSINELFGGSSKGAGFAQLAGYDSNGDGKVDASDAGFGDLRVWQDADGDHVTDAGELKTLEEAGVASIATGFVELPFVDAQGNLHLERSSATMADGSTADVTDVYFNVAREDADAAGVDLSSLAELMADDAIDLSGACAVAASNEGAATLDVAALLANCTLDLAAEAAQVAADNVDVAEVTLIGHQSDTVGCLG